MEVAAVRRSRRRRRHRRGCNSVKRSPNLRSPPPVPEDEPAAGSDEKDSARTLVTGIYHVSSADSSSVIIDMQGEVQYEAHRLGSPERIYIDLHDTSLAAGMFGKTIEIGDARLERIRVAQPRKGISRVVLETTGASDFSVSLQSKPYRLVVEIRKRGALRSRASRSCQNPRSSRKPRSCRRPCRGRKISWKDNCGHGCRSFAWCSMPATAAGTWERWDAKV